MAAAPLNDWFAALAAFDWAADAAPLQALDAAVTSAVVDPALRADLEQRFLSILKSPASRAAKEYACRHLRLIGTATAVPELSSLLGDPSLSHMARFALERIDDPAAAEALRAALPIVGEQQAIGIISSLADRRDSEAVPLLAALLNGPEPLAIAAALALGRIAGPAAAAPLVAAAPSSEQLAEAVADARVACGQSLLAAGDRVAAQTLFAAVAAAVGDAPTTRRARGLRIAARGGLLDCTADT